MTQVSICNQALSWLGANTITSIDDNTKEARICKANYDHLLLAVLEDGEWSFATRRYELTPKVETPVYGYGQSFAIPPDTINVLSVTDGLDHGSNVSDHEMDWMIEGNVIVATADKIWVRTTHLIIDTVKFSPGFRQTFAARMAAEMAIHLTNSRSMAESMWGLYAQKKNQALANDGIQGRSEKLVSSQLANIRQKGYFQ